MNDLLKAALALCDELRKEITRLENELQFEQGAQRSQEQRIDALYSDLAARERECEQLQYKLRAEMPRETHTLREQNTLLLSLIQLPTLAANIVAYMSGEGAAEWRKGNKIPVIKSVRNLTRDTVMGVMGLKEAKDFCEAYPYPPLPSKNESNVSHPICRDSSCLNGAD